MTLAPKSIRVCCVSIVLLLVLDLVHRQIGLNQSTHGPDNWVTSAAGLRPFLLEQESTVADIYFLRMIQNIGTASEFAAGYPNLAPLAEAVTEVDPLYGYAFEVAGIVLSDLAKRYEDSNRVLDKGMLTVPNRWQLPFFAAFNRWYGQGDYRGAVPYLLRAASLPGSPGYLTDLASRLLSETGDIEASLALIDTTLAQDIPLQVRQELANRRERVAAEIELRKLDAGVARFVSKTGRNPASIGELVAKEGVDWPSSAMEYEPRTGRFSSPLLPDRLHLFRADAPRLPGL